MAESQRPGRDSDGVNAVVYHSPEREKGAGVEPEEQAAEVVQAVPIVVTVGSSPMARDVPMTSLPKAIQKAAMTLHGHIAHQTTAGELAASMRIRCGGCRHFDPEGWQKVKREAEASFDRDRLLELNVIRGLVERSENAHLREMHDLAGDGSLDLEHALNSLGLCRALTEHLKEAIFTHPVATCPDDQPFFFEPKRELRARRDAASAYDWLLTRAEKGPER